MLTRAVSCHRAACFDVCGVHNGKSADGYVLGMYGCRPHTNWEGLGYQKRPQESVTYGLILPSDSNQSLKDCGSERPECGHTHGPCFESRDIDKRMAMHS